MNTGEARPGGWPWGLIALLLALLAWAGLFGAGLAFAASMGSPGDGNHGMQAMQYWILAALLVLGGSLISSGLPPCWPGVAGADRSARPSQWCC